MARRRLIIYSLLACAVILAAAIVFIVTFDADRYRTEIEAALAERLDHAVLIGKIETSLLPEPLVIITDLRIGEPEKGFAFSAERLTLKPKSKRLLTGDFHFHEIIAESPHLLATLDTPLGAGKPPADNALQDIPITIDSLSAVNASWQLKDLRRRKSPRSYGGEDFAIAAEGITRLRVETLEASGTLKQGGEKGKLSFSGRFEAAGLAKGGVEALKSSGTLRLGGSSAKMNLNGHVIAQDGADWRHSDIAMDIDTAPLDDAFLARLPLPGHTLEGPAALTLGLHGRAASGIDTTARLDGRQILLRDTGSGRIRWRSDAVALAASLQIGPDRLDIRNLALKTGDLSLKGSLLARQISEGILLEAKTGDAALPLEFVHSAPFAKKRRLRLDSAQLALLLDDARLPGLKDGVPPEGMPQPDALEFSGAGRIEAMKEKDGLAGSIPIRLTATASNLSDAEPLLEADIQTTFSEENLPEVRERLENEDLEIGGKTGIRLRLSGAPANIRFDLEADLEGLSLESGKLLSKQEEEGGRLTLQGQRRDRGWDITAGTLALPPLNLTAEGRLRLDGEPSYDLSLKLAATDLAEAHSLMPILEKIGLSGEVEGELEVSPASRKGIFELHNVGLPVPGKLAELNHLNGTVRLDGRRLEAPQLEALLGESPVDLSLLVEDLSQPRFDIHLESHSMRANDLIFPNRQAYLRDLVADFTVSADGLHLIDVRTRLDGGTVAHVEGTIAPFSAPDTMLAVDAEYGNIDEVIDLFRGPESERERPEEAKKKTVGEVLIDITADKGRFSTLKFTDAEGFLVIRDGLLTIHPLSFHSANGYFTGMLLRNGAAESPRRLKISGHLEDFSAETLYNEQLKRRGIITGNLRGDFYLEGIEGKEAFLKNSRGTFNVQIDGGVLRKFKVLAKIFSILNVSQLFNFDLPDTSSRGMPYDKLAANVRLREGILRTDDMFIDSKAMNMTLVGKVNLIDKGLDLTIGVKPLQTVDKIITKIPIAGWLLTGEEKALITAHFEVTGTTDDPKVRPIPISSVSEKAKGVFRRLFDLPGKIIEDVEDIFD